MLALGRIASVKLFRNNIGTGWVGKTESLRGGGIIIRDPRRLDAGLIEGSSDLIGWTTREITPEMVGAKVAIFTALEVKKGAGRISPAQLNFLEQVRRSGGISGIITNEEEAKHILNNYSI